jgi:L-ribulose-5-phosphate 3-epimerase
MKRRCQTPCHSKDKLLAAKESGFAFLELCIDQDRSRQNRLDWPAKARADLRHFMSSNTIAAATLSLGALRDFPLGSPSPGRASHGIGMLKKSIDLESDLRCRIVLINAYDVFAATSPTRALSTARTRCPGSA